MSDNSIITVVEHEDYINQFAGTQFGKGKRCDYMMFDEVTHGKIMFCDLGCYSEKYVEKKQRESHQQVCDSLSRFILKQCGKDFIDQFAEKILIFGRRDPAINTDVPPVPSKGDVKNNMLAFLTTPLSKSKIVESKETVEGTDVSFLIVNYPETYKW